MRFPLLVVPVAVLAATTAVAQSITAEVRAATQLQVRASQPGAPPVVRTVAAGTLLVSGFESSVSIGGGQAQASTGVTVSQLPALYRLREATSSIAGSTADCGPHDTRLSLDVTRAYSGDVVVRWNGIEQTDGDGSLAVSVDIDDDGTFELSGVDGETLTRRYARSWDPSAPLQILVRTAAQCSGTLSPPSAFKGILEIEFEPDAATVSPGDFDPFGFGCGSVSLIAPVLIGAGVTGPLVGEAFTASVDSLSPNTNSITMLVGFNELPVPVSLAPIGMELCFLFLDPVITFPVALPFPGQPANWTITIPGDTNLIGLRFVTQAFVVEPTVPGLGAMMSNPARGLIGGR